MIVPRCAVQASENLFNVLERRQELLRDLERLHEANLAGPSTALQVPTSNSFHHSGNVALLLFRSWSALMDFVFLDVKMLSL